MLSTPGLTTQMLKSGKSGPTRRDAESYVSASSNAAMIASARMEACRRLVGLNISVKFFGRVVNSFESHSPCSRIVTSSHTIPLGARISSI